MNHYKLRSECMADITNLKERLNEQGINVYEESMDKMYIGNMQIPDMIYSFKTEETLENIKCAIQDVEDGHVMYETIETVENFTGERR